MAFPSADDLLDVCRERFEAPLAAAEREFGLIADLAESIGRALGEWAALTARMELAAKLDPVHARALVLETVFDEALAATAWRVLPDLLEAA
jgi:hypothetical protein